jgi:branched-chain amino acid transport system ATP-binding protein
MAKLEILQLVTGYARLPAVHGVSLRVETGEFIGVIGANGAGKTTLLRAISGVIPAFSGEVSFDGERITGRSTSDIVRRGIIQVPEGRAVFQDMSVEENLLLGAYRRRDAQIGDDLEKMYNRFPILRTRRSLLAAKLSGGEQSMLSIGRALMARPALLLLDEPSLGLAPIIRKSVQEALTQLLTDGLTVLLVEQNVSIVLALASRIYVVETGRVVFEGTPDEVRANGAVAAAYLGQRALTEQATG